MRRFFAVCFFVMLAGVGGAVITMPDDLDNTEWLNDLDNIWLNRDEGIEASICGLTDDRIPVNDFDFVFSGRLTNGCSAFLVADDFAVSAGHCFVGPEDIYMEFNVPLSTQYGERVPTALEDIYSVLRDTGAYCWNQNEDDCDYAIFKLDANPITGLTAGEAQGGYYYLLLEPLPPTIPHLVTVAGHGHTGRDIHDELCFTLRKDTGPLIKLDRGVWYWYQVDTEVGGSGSAVMYQGFVIAVHTHGGCTGKPMANRGNSVFEPNFQEDFNRLVYGHLSE